MTNIQALFLYDQTLCVENKTRNLDAFFKFYFLLNIFFLNFNGALLAFLIREIPSPRNAPLLERISHRI